MRYALRAAVSVATGLCCFGYWPLPVATVLRPFCRPRGALSAGAATSVLEGFLIDQAISILAQAKLRRLAKLYDLEFSRDKKEDHEDSTTRTEHQDRILFVAWFRTIIWWTLHGWSKATIEPEISPCVVGFDLTPDPESSR